MHIFYLIAFLLFLTSPTTWADDFTPKKSSFKSCAKTTLINRDDRIKNRDYWDALIHDDCLNNQGKGHFQTLPKTGLNITQLQEGAQSLNFLFSVGEQALVSIDKNLQELEKVKECLRYLQSKNTKCMAVISKLKEFIHESQEKARQALAIIGGESPRVSMGVFTPPQDKNLVTPHLGDGISSSLIPQELSALTKDEKTQIESELKKTIINLQEAITQKSITPEEAGKKFNEIKERQKNIYFETLEKAPIILYLGSSIPEGDGGHQMLLSAINKLMANGTDQKNHIKKLLKNGAFEYSDHFTRRTPSEQALDMSEFMAFNPIIEDLLRKDPSLCGIAQGLADHNTYASWREDAAVLSGTIAASVVGSLLFPPSLTIFGAALSGSQLVSLSVGVPLSVGYIYKEKVDLESSKEAALTGIKDSPLRSFSQVQEKEEHLNWTMALAPLSFISAGTGDKLKDFTAKFFLQSAIKKGEGLSTYNSAELNALIVVANTGANQTSKKARDTLRDLAIDELKTKYNLSQTVIEKVDELADLLTSKGLLGSPQSPDGYILHKLILAIQSARGKEKKFIGAINNFLKDIPLANVKSPINDRIKDEIIDSLVTLSKTKIEPKDAPNFLRTFLATNPEINQLLSKKPDSIVAKHSYLKPSENIVGSALSRKITKNEYDTILDVYYKNEQNPRSLDGLKNQMEKVRKLRSVGFTAKEITSLIMSGVFNGSSTFGSIQLLSLASDEIIERSKDPLNMSAEDSNQLIKYWATATALSSPEK